MLPRRSIFPLLLLIISFSAVGSEAADASFMREADGEYCLLTGYGITHRGFGATRTEVQTFDTILRYGRFLSGNLGDGWYRGRHELLIELPLHLAVNHDGRIMTGAYLLGSWKFTNLREIVPYLFAGGGILFDDLGLPTTGSRLDFSYQGGCGVQYFIGKQVALSSEYRYHHVSNAGTASLNEPLNSSKLLLGISLFH